MGKHKKQNLLKTQRKTPAILPVDEDVRQKKVLPIISGLKSLSESERLEAITAILSVVENRSILHMLLRERLIKIILTTTITDSNLEIVALSLQVLRTISLYEGRDPSLYMVRENIKLPLQSISGKVINSNTNLSEEEFKLLSLLASNCMGLTSAILISVGEMKGIRTCIELASRIVTSNGERRFSPECIIDAFELIYYTSECECDTLLDVVREQNLDVKKFCDISSQFDSWNAKTYGLGTEFNVLISGDAELDSDEASSKLGDIVKRLGALLLKLPESETNNLQVCLELLAIASQTDDLDLITMLVTDVQPKVLELMQVSDLKANCISVLNNIGWSLNGLGQDWVDISTMVINRTMETCFPQQSNLYNQDPELTSMALGLLGSAIMQNISVITPNSPLTQLVGEVMKLIEKLFDESNVEWADVTRSLVVLLAIPAEGETIASKINMVRQTSQLIFLALEKSSDAETQIDALNALFDVFSDNDAPFNQTEYNEQGLNQKLEQLKPSIKRVLKSIPKNEPVKRQQALDALTNVEQFIIYKKSP